jgi:hypothetical protein
VAVPNTEQTIRLGLLSHRPSIPNQTTLEITGSRLRRSRTVRHLHLGTAKLTCGPSLFHKISIIASTCVVRSQNKGAAASGDQRRPQPPTLEPRGDSGSVAMESTKTAPAAFLPWNALALSELMLVLSADLPPFPVRWQHLELGLPVPGQPFFFWHCACSGNSLALSELNRCCRLPTWECCICMQRAATDGW